MATTQTRRCFLNTLSFAGVAGLASALDKPAAAETLERQPSV